MTFSTKGVCMKSNILKMLWPLCRNGSFVKKVISTDIDSCFEGLTVRNCFMHVCLLAVALTVRSASGQLAEIAPSFTNWNRQANGIWAETAEGLKVSGSGYRLGNGIETKAVYDFTDSEVYFKWKAHGSGYMGIGLNLYPLGVAAGNFTTHHSYAGSKQISDDLWYYTHFRFSGNTNWTVVTSSGNYDNAGGTVFLTRSGNTGTNALWVKSGNLKLHFGDNYSGENAYLIAGEVKTSARKLQDAPVFHQDFEDGTMAANMTVQGTWSITDNAYNSARALQLSVSTGDGFTLNVSNVVRVAFDISHTCNDGIQFFIDNIGTDALAGAGAGQWRHVDMAVPPSGKHSVKLQVYSGAADGTYVNNGKTVIIDNLTLYSETDGVGEYLLIDLSGGTAAVSYPVTVSSGCPVSGWTDDYKTTKLVMRRIPKGTFSAGSPTNELGRFAEETQRTVRITHDYYLGVFEVTQRQWELVMGNRPSTFANAAYYASRPVEMVSYSDIRGSSLGSGWPMSRAVDETSFLGILRAKTGLADLDLPTGTQWERACRAETVTALNSGKDLSNPDYCSNISALGRYWFNGGSGNTPNGNADVATAKVGSYLPNAWGLYDMHGNVWEWCLDWYGTYEGVPLTDPSGPLAGTFRSRRGGSWWDTARECRSARVNYWSNSKNDAIGFRLASSLLYRLTVVGGTGSGTYAVGTAVPVVADTPPAGQSFLRWVITTGDGDLGAVFGNTDSETTVSTPECATTLTAVFATFKNISSIEELQRIGSDSAYPLDGGYTLAADIDATATSFWNGGTGWQPVGNWEGGFSGVFDGQGHVIRGLTLVRPLQDDVGLFGFLEPYATIRNTTLTGCYIVGSNTVGSLAGAIMGRVENCHSEGSVTGQNNTGGLVGISDGALYQCSAAGSVKGGRTVGGLLGRNCCGKVAASYSSASVTGTDYMGGLVGENGFSSAGIHGSYATGAVTGASTFENAVHGYGFGGLVGYNESLVSHCYAAGEVMGGYTGFGVGGLIGINSQTTVSDCYATGHAEGCDDVGRLVGINKNDSGETGTFVRCFAIGTLAGYCFEGDPGTGLVDPNEAINSYWDYESGGASGVGEMGAPDSAGRTTVQMWQQATFANWDFVTVWAIMENQWYPYLRSLSGFKMAFDVHGGTLDRESATVTNGCAYGPLPVPARGGYAFSGWWRDAEGTGVQVVASGTVKTLADFTVYAKWTVKPANEDACTVGVLFNMPLPGAYASATKVTVSGLPPGLKYNAATRQVEGVPTRAGTYAVLFSAPGVTSQTVKVTAIALPAWAQGTFSGYVAGGGLASMTVSAAGKATGKVSLGGTNYAFNTTSYLAGGNAETGFEIEATAKAGKAEAPLSLTVIQDGLPTTRSAAFGTWNWRSIALWRNIWKAETATLEPFIGYYTATLPGDAQCGSGYLTFTVDKAGKVKTAGKLADGTAVTTSGSLILDFAGRVFAAVYAAPTAYKGGCLFGLVEFVDPAADDACLRLLDDEPFLWESLNPQATGEYGEGFGRALGLSGGWYNKLATLRDHYADGLTVVSDGDFPALQVSVKITDYDPESESEIPPKISWTETYETSDTGVSPNGLALSLNAAGTAFIVPKSTTPSKVTDPETGDFLGYNYDELENPCGLTFTLTKATGLFKGAFNIYYDYVSAEDFTSERQTWAHVVKKTSLQGILTPVREDASDGFGGRGFFLWADKSSYENTAGKTVPYGFSWSYDFLLLEN